MRGREKYVIYSILLVLVTLFQVNQSIEMMPMCQACAADDGSSCIVCGTCQKYAVLVSGYCQCDSGYYINQDDPSKIYCDRCHTSCKKCFGPLASNCISCSDRFDFVQDGSYCKAPNNSTDQTLIEAYSFYGFSYQTGWSFTTQTAGVYATLCGERSILGGVGVSLGSSPISVSYTSPNIPYHFSLRIKMGFYILNSGGSTAEAWVSVSPSASTVNRTYSYGSTSINSCGGTDYIHFNIDDSFPHDSTTATIQIGLTQNQWFGIRQFYLIAKKCKSQNCSLCTGYLPTQCTQCVDNKRIANSQINPGTCLCNGFYYQQPYAGQCVDPCPSVPIQYYGDPTTRYCQTTCPTGYYALDDTYRCVDDCPVTSTKSGYLLFKDKTNRKCVSTCPDTQPYAYPLSTDRFCHATCPTGTYATDAKDRRCVTTCPYNSTYKLYGHNGKCIAVCPLNYWADPFTVKCLTNCSSPAYPFKDNSTGTGICVSMCPPANYFGQTTNYTCVDICPTGTYGERYDASNNLLQMCIAKCNSPRWGLVTDNRKCVDFCPQNYWGEPVNRLCTNVSADCNPLFADNYTRKCVTPTQCSFGFFADNSTWRCVPYCPTGSYAHPISRICQTQCDAPYFRDPGINACVLVCNTIGTYADVSSTRTCVSICNITGLTPWADDSTRTCVGDCNQTVGNFLSDNTTWKCGYQCPTNYYEDWTTSAPKCVASCPPTYYADSSTGKGVCVQTCPAYPRRFGDVVSGKNVCVDVCSINSFGDQTGFRLCKPTCPSPYFAQNDAQRLCVLKCKDKTYGWNNVCLTDPKLCPSGYFGDDLTNLCVNLCPQSQGTFGDPESKMCVRKCPLNPLYPTTGPQNYFADISNRLCVLTCNASYSTGLFGNNNTRTCQTKCLDRNSFAQVQTLNRLCVAVCLQSPSFYYSNNDTQVCGPSINCQLNYYGENLTQSCVQSCPTGSFAYKTNLIKLCIDQCPIDSSSIDWYGDITTGKRICVTQCPSLPLRFSDPTTKLCVETCPPSYYADTVLRQCVTICPSGYFAHQTTRRCVQKCPDGYFGDDTSTVRYCHPNSALCATRFGDPYKNLCVGICTGPAPFSYFGSGDDCVLTCPSQTYADSDTGTRLCVSDCPDDLGSGGRDLYGDPLTRSCVPKCIKPLTWADSQTRDCESTCSALPIPTYSQNFNMRCVQSLNCPTSPSMTFGDNSTRSCLSNCTNNQFGDPTTRNCVTQCPKLAQTGTQHYYGDVSTGINLCVTVCPSTPRLFGNNDTNLCVGECPQPYYGDQTGKRSCLPQCPIVSGVYYYAQNISRICVKICISGTWGLQSSRQCVEDPFLCGTQWADNTTNMCVTTCPATSGLYGDETTKFCVSLCPPNYFSDDKTRTCVQKCPSDHGAHGTFGNNSTRVCQQICSQPNAFADPQTVNRYCVSQCSQSPSESFADPSTKTCVSQCPVFPNLFAQTQTFTCSAKCISPYFGNTNTHRCQLSCPTSQFKLNGSQLCVSTCPQNPDLYGDSNSGFCQSQCTNNYHRFPTDQACISSCKAKGFFTYNHTCVKFCPYGFYADSNGICISTCISGTFGENTTTECLSTCITGYAQGSLCVAKCDDGLFGQNKVCKSSCTAPARASNQTNLCVSMCETGTYLLNGKCELACTTGLYADPSINECSSSCKNNLFGDPTTNKCVEKCPIGYYRDITGYCLDDCSVNSRRADNITWNCQPKCSNGTWGYNFGCVKICPSGYFGYTVDRDCYALANPPETNLFADNTTQTWVSICPFSPLLFGDRTKKQCVSDCITGELADPFSRQCQTSCTDSSYFADFTTKKCVIICPAGNFSNSINNKCEDKCTGGKFAYQPSHQCVDTCPAPYFGHNDGNGLLVCKLKCPNGTYAQGRLCVLGCAVLFADSIRNLCVDQCLNSYANVGTQTCETNCYQFGKIADNSSNTCVNQCPTDPDLYEQNDICVPQCSDGFFADPTSGIRSCRSGCTSGLYAEPESKRCLSTCKPGYFVINSTNKCSKTCPSGLFADKATGYCQSTCTPPTLADSLLNQCVKICSGDQFGQNGICVPQCSDPNFANPLTRTCQTSCPQFDYLFAQNTTHSCVKDCKPFTNSFADKNTRKCMSSCSLTLEYALVNEGKCVGLCPQGLFMDNDTKRCQTTCTNGFAQPTSRYCVARCFGAPDTYGHTDSNGVKTCKYKCLSNTQNLYTENRTNLCVSTCIDPMFSDPLTGNCVLFCPQGLYAQQTDRTCTSKCNSTQFADNLTRSCVNQCPTSTQQTFGYFGNNTCVRICPDGFYARNDSKQCVLAIDCETGSWGDQVSKSCVSRCPSDPLSFGYDTEKLCVSTCPQIDDLYGEFINQKCVSGCELRDGKQTYADPYSRTCVFQCPIQQQLWADPSDKRCKQQCSGSMIRDNSTQMCVQTCPNIPQSYADLDSKFCVRTCPNGTFASDQITRICTDDCSLFSLTFGDNTTNKCTTTCQYPYFADNSTYLCVLNCPAILDYYADPHSRTCVLKCPKSTNWVSYADPNSRSCVTKCSQGSYAVNSTQRCLPQCPPNQYADQQLNLCVADCTVRPGFYKEINSRVCVSQCPTDIVQTFKYDVNHSCVYWNNGQSGCPSPYYGNPLNKMCTTKCPEGYFAQDSSRMCVLDCQVDLVADPTDRKCKSSCTNVPQYYAFDLLRVCVQHCPSPYYQNNQTHRCTLDCSTNPMMFRYDETRQCVFNCYYPYFSYTNNQTCLKECPSGFYAQQSTRSCVAACDNPYFADDSTNKCVQVCPSSPDYYGHLNICQLTCPNGWYRDNSTRLCVQQCPIQPLLFADNSTNTCVKYCPADQNFFADNMTRKCVLHCSVGLFAQVQSRTCLKTCPKNLLTYADPITHVCQPTCPNTYYASDVTKQCVQLCPDQPSKTYAHIDKCLQRCPQNYYGENTTRTCRLNCSNIQNIFADDTTNLCVTTCPQGLFAQNTTDKCVPQCPVGSYADPTTRICVEKCPGTERLFADPSNQRCVSQCSLGYYGDSLEWVCLQSCPDTASGYRLDVGRLCVEECPSPYFAFLPTRTCVQNCGRGLYGDAVTRTCKDCPSQCPTCLSPTNCLSCIATKFLSYGKCVDECILTNEVANYANDETRSCVIATKCPSGMYGLNSTKKCSSQCLAQMYKNTTLRRCENCPQYCSACINSTHCTNCTNDAIFSQQDNFCYPYCNSTHHFYLKDICVQLCPTGTYLDYTAVNCEKCNEICQSCFGNALNCTTCFQSFKYEDKCVSQCPTDHYGENAQCKPCTAQIESCVKPLSFSVVQTTQNFQPVLVVKFNQETVIKGNPKDFVKVRLSMKSRRLQNQNTNNKLQLLQYRRLQSSADMINQGLYFDAQVLPDGSLKLKLNPGQSLDNANFQIVFTDANAVQTKSGQSLQSLQAQIQLATVEIYPSDLLASASSSFEIVSIVLSIAIIVPVFTLLICSPVAIFYQLQAFQLISLFAYFNEIPPNLFYFLRKLKLTRFTFLPNIFAYLYKQPSYFTQNIPASVAQTQGQLSFTVNASGFIVIALIYVFISGVLYLASSKYNSNRPLRNIFMNIYNTRVKYGALNDLLWIFSINVFVSAFMQYRFTDNGGDVALGTISMLAFLTGICFIIYKIVQYHKIPFEENDRKTQMKGNVSFLIQGFKEQNFTQHTISIYYIRKILFSLIIAATINNSFTQAIILLILQFIFCAYLIIKRPFIDNIRTGLTFLNEFGIGFIPCGIMYFIKIKQMKEPIGHKIICGEIITYVIIAHLSILIIWAYFRLYFFVKQLYKVFKQTQFFKLYMDEEFENQLQKQIKELNDQENGEVESVQITNYNDKNQHQNQDDGDLIIKLKIKRKRLLNKNKNKPIQNDTIVEPPKRHNKSEYTKLQNPLEETQIKYQHKDNQFQKVSIHHNKQQQPNKIQENFKEQPNLQNQIQNKMRKSIHDEEWTVMKFEKNAQKQKQNCNKNKQDQHNEELVEIQRKNNEIMSHDGYQLQSQQIAIISEINQEISMLKENVKELITQEINNNQYVVQIDNKKQQIQHEFQMIQASQNIQQNKELVQQKVQNIQQIQQLQQQDDQWLPYHINQKQSKKQKSNINLVHQDPLMKNEQQNYYKQQILKNQVSQNFKLQQIPISQSHIQNDRPAKQLNNWAELQNLLDDEDDQNRKAEKKKIQMIIFDDEEFESEKVE